ncbi:MAG: hypothetical protein WC390_09160 [Sulfurimonas sp.]|jgi:hypothetical protein
MKITRIEFLDDHGNPQCFDLSFVCVKSIKEVCPTQESQLFFLVELEGDKQQYIYNPTRVYLEKES